MKAKDWEKQIKANINDNEWLVLLGKMLEETEQAKQELKNKGYGWLGLSLLQTVIEEVPDNN